MSRDNLLARQGLLHLADDRKALEEELYRRELLEENFTEEELIEDNKDAAEWGLPQIDIPKYMADRERVRQERKESNKG